jgi:hypothetical protein
MHRAEALRDAIGLQRVWVLKSLPREKPGFATEQKWCHLSGQAFMTININ